MKAPRRPGVARGLAAIAVLLGCAILASPTAHATDADAAATLAWFDRMEDYFESRPELKTTPGSGWKPYNRYRWFHEQRMTNGELPSPTARWEVWQIKQERSRQNGTRGTTWFTLGPTNLAGRMLAIDFDPIDPSIVYTGGADGGVWKSTDTGATWVPMSDELPSLAVGGLAVSKTVPNLVVIGTGEGTFNIDRVGGVGILRSTDGGSTWDTTNLSLSVASGHGFHFVKSGPNGTFLAGATDGLWRSSDDGQTWTAVKAGGDYYDAVWKPGDPDRIYTVKGNHNTGNNVKVSTDNGLTWTGASSGLPNMFVVGKSKLAVTASNPDVVYALIGDTGGSSIQGVYKTSNNAASWTAQNTSPGLLGGQIWYNLALAVDPDNEATVLAGGVSLKRSTNNGVSFTSIGGVHSDHHAVAYQPGNNNNLMLGGDGGNYWSTNDGASFSYRSTNLVTYQFYDICVNNGPEPYYVFGGTQDNGTDKWSGSTSWSQGLGGDGMVCAITAVSGTKVYAETQNGNHFRNNNSGVGNWASIMSGITGSGAWVTPFANDRNLGAHCYTSTSNGIFRTTDSGNSWVNVAPHTARWISISPVNGNIVWTTLGTTYVTTDDGSTWTQCTAFPFPAGGATKIEAHPNDPASAIVVFSSYSTDVAHVALTTDYGITWTDVSGDLPGVPCNAVVINPSNDSQWFVGTDVGVWLSENGGANWLPFDAGLPNAVIADLEIQDALQKIVAGTHGRGAWEADIPLTQGTDAPEAVDLARHLMLDAPFPNPTRGEATLRFAARYDGPVSIDIFDVQGRRVSSLGELGGGDGVIRSTSWHTDDVPAGVYFAVLRAGDVTKSRKIVVAK